MNNSIALPRRSGKKNPKAHTSPTTENMSILLFHTNHQKEKIGKWAKDFLEKSSVFITLLLGHMNNPDFCCTEELCTLDLSLSFEFIQEIVPFFFT